jgi:RNA polymerase sigma-70 factor, ECF subfamily
VAQLRTDTPASADAQATADAPVTADTPVTADAQAAADTPVTADTPVMVDTPVTAEPEATELPGADTTGTADLTAAVAGARRGDSDSFRVLYRDTQPRLLRYLTYLVGGDAEDIASETWLQATRDLHSFQGNYENFRGWITTIARHRALDHLRRHSRQPAVPVPIEDLDIFAAADDTADRAIESITTDDALQLIAVLPRDQAEAVMLRTIVGLDARTAASITGKRAGAVRTAAYRGLHTLAKHLADRKLPTACRLNDQGFQPGKARS